MNGRRAIVRWAWRLARREWRQQVLVAALLTLAVTASCLGITVAFHLAPVPSAGYGTADHRIVFDGSDPAALATSLTMARQHLGTVDEIARRSAPIPGSVETVELRAQDPHGPYGARMLRLARGRYPAGAGEVAVTDEVARTFKTGLGARFTLDGRERTVVGLVENPGDLDDDFALVHPAHDDAPAAVTVLVKTSRENVRNLNREAGGTFESRSDGTRTEAATGILAVSTVGLLLVSLIAAAGFVVMGQRRLRQLGMLAAIGATGRQLRLVTLASGALIGAVAAASGTVIAIGAWVASAPGLEPVVAHRIGRLDVPWPQILVGMILAVVTATAAAWWPARTVARIPITSALSARPPRPQPARRSIVAAVILGAAGTTCLAMADLDHDWLYIVGILATALAVLFAAPVTVRVAGRTAGRFPIAARLALRDLSRQQARSGSALAAISLALGIAVAVIAATAAAAPAADEGNLSDRQILFRIGDPEPHLVPERTEAELTRMRSRIDGFAATLDGKVLVLDRPVDPEKRREAGADGREGGLVTVVLGTPKDTDTMRDIVYYVATPELLRHYGVSTLDADILTVQNVELVLGKRFERVTRVQRLDAPAHTSAPTTLISETTVRARGWTTGRAGWLVEAGAPLTEEQRAQARETAVAAGLTVEIRRDQRSTLAAVRSGATTAGALLALGILAMAVGLIRGETSRDLRTLTASGATATNRRTLTATTAAALALLGAALGTAGAYSALAAGYSDDLGELKEVPVAHLATIIVGLPLLAALAAWMLPSREPPGISRQPID